MKISSQGDQSITIRRPDDFHVHVRDGEMMKLVLPFTAKRFARAIIMPNLTPPVLTWQYAEAYRKEIVEALPPGSGFMPLMTVYLTDQSDPHNIAHGFAENVIKAVKLYPKGATTNSESGVTEIKKTYKVLEVMERMGIPLLIHGELVVDEKSEEIDPFDREKRFIPIIAGIRKKFPGLKIVFEHVTTGEGIRFVREEYSRKSPTAATITPHHLIIDRRDIFRGGIRPDQYCLPIAKEEKDRLALREAAVSGLSCFFLGTDSAPHSKEKKYCECGKAGIFNAHAAIELCAEVFAAEHRLSMLEAFTSRWGANFYGLLPNEGTTTLTKEPWRVPALYGGVVGGVVPFRANEEIAWSVQE
jgi:dihydroorotase